MMSVVNERVGIFGGSFDPIHNGHLILARDARERLGLDRVVFVPAGVSPFKTEAPPADAEVRLEMVRAAVAGEPGFAVDDVEVRRGGTSFAVETVRQIRGRAEHGAGTEFFYFIGSDNVADLGAWKEIGALREMVTFVVLSRAGESGSDEGLGMPVVRRLVDISSTEVRNRVARGLSIQYLCPQCVCAVISRESLYCDGRSGD